MRPGILDDNLSYRLRGVGLGETAVRERGSLLKGRIEILSYRPDLRDGRVAGLPRDSGITTGSANGLLTSKDALAGSIRGGLA